MLLKIDESFMNVDPIFNFELVRDPELLIPWKASWFENAPTGCYYYPFEENNTEAATSGG